MITKDGRYVANGFPLGMNNRQPDHALPDGAVRNAVNVDIDPMGMIGRRDGYAKILGGINTHSGWSCDLWTLYVDSGTLKYLDANDVAHALVAVEGPVCYHYYNNVVYFSDGVKAFKLLASGTVTQWGAAPLTAPILSTVAGTLPAGTYLGAITPIGYDGSEHGASEIAYVQADDNSSILFSLPVATDPQVEYLRIYLSPANGETLYAVVDVPNGSLSYTVTAAGQGSELTTIGIAAMPAGREITSYNGVMYVASGNEVWHSETYAPDRLRPSNNYISHEKPVTLLAAATVGLWVATDKTYLYRGTGPGAFNVELKAEYGAVPGQAYKIPNSNDLLWYSTRGIVRAGGDMINLQEEQVATETGDAAAVFLREQDGIQQIIASVSNPTVSKLASKSFLDMEVIRKAG